MKKMLVLVMVLGLASLVSAGLTTVSSTEPFVLTINAAAAGDYVDDLFIDYSPLLAIPGFNGMDAVLTGVTADIPNLGVFTQDTDGFSVYMVTLGKSSGTWANGATLATLDLNGAAANEGTVPVVLNLVDGNLDVIGQVTVLTNIPEPMTMALLGIGGLFFRRKK
ncbi:MAG: hypothetical protein A2Y10_00225 [Planctomycetes bacterium GWF2_41_51]|nr:MAG: hypothetical protein A2Y10_00225 [Planctomycetes bacterium GWF2_41_51]HBG27106.1 hypothetical protein [Phycisphaerales bacterium]